VFGTSRSSLIEHNVIVERGVETGVIDFVEGLQPELRAVTFRSPNLPEERSIGIFSIAVRSMRFFPGVEPPCYLRKSLFLPGDY
jgi:hypothetical protein